jgi:small subunit ribosomal protein S10e
MCAAKDFYKAKHDDVDVPNLEVIKLMQSLESRGYVKTTFNWQWYYWYLTDSGIEYLRGFLHLPAEVVPETHKKPAPRAGARQTEGDRPERGDRDRRGGDRGGFGRGRGGFRGGEGRPGCVPCSAVASSPVVLAACLTPSLAPRCADVPRSLHHVCCARATPVSRGCLRGCVPVVQRLPRRWLP